MFEAGIWRSLDGDVLLYRPVQPGAFPRRSKDMQKENYWQLLGLTKQGHHVLALCALRGRKFTSLREAKWALEWAQAKCESKERAPEAA